MINRIQLTPVALEEGMRVAHALYGTPMPQMDYRFIASAVFSQPTMGTCGCTETEAKSKFPGDITIYRSVFKSLKNSITQRKEKSLLKLVVQISTELVIGLHMAGPISW